MGSYFLKFFIFVFALLISHRALVACHFGNVYEDLECEQKALDVKKRALNKAHKQLFNSIDPPAQKHFEYSQKIWLKYRNSHCQGLVAKLNEQALGAGQILIITAYIVDLSDKRLLGKLTR